MKNRGFLLLLGLILAALWPVWIWYIRRTADGSDEPFGLVALIILAGFTLFRRREISFSKRQTLTAFAILLVFTLFFGWTPPLIRAAIGFAAIAFFCGRFFLQPGIAGLLLLSLPIVASLQYYAGYPLRLISAESTTWLLNLFGSEVTRSGTDLIFRGTSVGVDPACSGIKMLWFSYLITAVLAATHRLSWKWSILFGLFATFAAIFGNVIRVGLLFFKESGQWSLPEWMHGGIGMLVFLGIAFALFAVGSKFPKIKIRTDSVEIFPLERRWQLSCALLALFAAISPALQWDAISFQGDQDFGGWPKKWNEHWLEPMPLTRQEMNFAKGFPGKIGVFQAGRDRVILRWINRPTRKLHSSADCLRATGFEVINDRPGDFFASKGQRKFQVMERIYEDELHSPNPWSDVSRWFWDSAFKRSEGPWIAITVVSPVYDSTVSSR